MKFIFFFILIIVHIASYFTDVTTLGVSLSQHSILNSFSYIFTHTNLLHLIVNIWCINIMIKYTKPMWYLRFKNKHHNLLFCISILCSALCGYLVASNDIMIGSSGVAWFYLGYMITELECPIKSKYSTLLLIFLNFLIAEIFNFYNVPIHLSTLLCGMLFSIAIDIYECGRYYKNQFRTNC